MAKNKYFKMLIIMIFFQFAGEKTETQKLPDLIRKALTHTKYSRVKLHLFTPTVVISPKFYNCFKDLRKLYSVIWMSINYLS